MKIPNDVKKDITKRYKAMLRELPTAEIDDNTGKVNCYRCDKCHNVTKTIEREKGSTPMGIICPVCGDNAFSTFYQDIAPDKEPTFEWVRPTLEETLEMHNTPIQCNFVLAGGLVRKEIRR